MRQILLFAFLLSFSACDLLMNEVNDPYTNKGGGGTTTTTTTTGSKIELRHTGCADCQLLKYNFFDISFSPKWRNPQWATYTLTADKIGTDAAERSSTFRQDPNATNCPATAEYTGTGYDRGHIVAAEDMSFDPTAMAESFFMTNVSPQDPALNRGIWKSLEDRTRKWAVAHKKIHIVSGAILPKRKTSTLEYIGANEDILVPQQFFKIVIADGGKGKRSGIAFLFDNEKSELSLKEHIVSIDEIEQLTGLDFFTTLSQSEQTELESKTNPDFWGDL